jgi:hypothetical protein
MRTAESHAPSGHVFPFKMCVVWRLLGCIERKAEIHLRRKLTYKTRWIMRRDKRDYKTIRTIMITYCLGAHRYKTRLIDSNSAILLSMGYRFGMMKDC